MTDRLITLLTLTPLVGGLLVSLFARTDRAARAVALVFNVAALLLVVAVSAAFNPGSPGLQALERYAWIPSLNIDYFVAVDGLGLLMVLLAAIVVPFAVLASPRIDDRPHVYYGLLLLLQAGLFGAFTALNFFHWFLFWELSLVPAYFLIKLWGGPDRTGAATQFFVYTLAGSVTMLLGFVAIYLATGSFDFIRLAEMRQEVAGGLASYFNVRLGWYQLSERTLAILIFTGILLGFAVKVPLFPFHTWLPRAYGEAPTAVTMVLTGAMSKMGVYGFLRILLPLFPEQMQWGLNLMLWLAVATIVFSAFAALAQPNLRRMLAYSSINHLGYCLLGIFSVAKWTTDDPQWSVERSAALNGVLLQMFNHGITAAALFCFVGFLERRTGTSALADFSGLRKAAPVFCGLMGISVFASLGLPGLNGFVGEFLIFKGVFPLASWAAALSVLGLLATAVFLLTMLQRVWNGPLQPRWTGFPDLTVTERLIVAPALAIMFVLGIYPQIVLQFTNPAVVQMIGHFAE
jgi:NADH-quinone oxidoreductase subunit M